jgi:hypothetical protein
MPSTRNFTITNGNPNPNGANAKLSRSGTGDPNQATWTAADDDYTVTLPTTVFSGTPNPFTVNRGYTSAVYTVLTNAPEGSAAYSIDPTGVAEDPPSVLIES